MIMTAGYTTYTTKNGVVGVGYSDQSYSVSVRVFAFLAASGVRGVSFGSRGFKGDIRDGGADLAPTTALKSLNPNNLCELSVCRHRNETDDDDDDDVGLANDGRPTGQSIVLNTFLIRPVYCTGVCTSGSSL